MIYIPSPNFALKTLYGEAINAFFQSTRPPQLCAASINYYHLLPIPIINHFYFSCMEPTVTTFLSHGGHQIHITTALKISSCVNFCSGSKTKNQKHPRCTVSNNLPKTLNIRYNSPLAENKAKYYNRVLYFRFKAIALRIPL